MLLICETHPVQYHAPVYQALHELNVPFHVVYGSNFSVAGYHDLEFQAEFAWDTDLLSGYSNSFLNLVESGGPKCYEESTPRGLQEAIQKSPVSAVLALGYRSAFDRGVIRACRRLKKPLLLRAEASDSALQRTYWKSQVRDILLRRLYRSCSAFLYIGQNALQHYRRLGVPEKKLFFSPYCVNSATFSFEEESRDELRNELRRKLGIAVDSRVVMFCGKLSHRKGVDLLVKAVKSLPSELRAKTELLLVGDGSLRGELLSAAAVEPAIKMHVTGFKNQKELSPFYHAADVLALPSIASETWGLVVNEALQHGLPCVVSAKVGCSSDLIVGGQTGEVAITNSCVSLKNCLEKVLLAPSTPLRRELCRHQVQLYSTANAAVGIRNAYCEIEKSDSKTRL